MSLQTSYRFIAPFYDLLLDRTTRGARRRSLKRLPEHAARVFLGGVGTGLDFPWLPARHDYVALDLTAAMLDQARPRSLGLNMELVQGDSLALPFTEASFDCVVLHLIVAVVPQPERCLAEAARVLRPGGTVLLFDKFLRPGQSAPLRRALSPLMGRIATRTDVIFEEVLAAVPELTLRSDEAALAGGWFRLIELEKS
jgi:ubiquinone/menaquinone biosynthesis C-methylase UbiE